MTTHDQQTRLKDVAPAEFMDGSYDHTPAYKLRDAVVTKHVTDKKWPGPQKNVSVWWVLDTGHAVGWNENPTRGWSFPVILLKSQNG